VENRSKADTGFKTDRSVWGEIYVQNIRILETADRDALLVEWRKQFKTEPPKSISRNLLKRILTFEIQASRLGGLDRATRQSIRAQQIQLDSGKPPRTKSVSFKAGSRFMREWNGVTHIIDVTENGYQWQGATYRSLSAIARAITGAHWSGPRFFRQTQEQDH
jgi:hypothetical protein